MVIFWILLALALTALWLLGLFTALVLAMDDGSFGTRVAQVMVVVVVTALFGVPAWLCWNYVVGFHR